MVGEGIIASGTIICDAHDAALGVTFRDGDTKMRDVDGADVTAAAAGVKFGGSEGSAEGVSFRRFLRLSQGLLCV